jgi:murein endopeptidase
MLRIVAASLVVIGLAAPVAAQSVFGSGGLQCQNWTANKNRKWQHLGDVDWLMGYASGINRARGPGSRLLGDQTRAEGDRFVTGYCAANPQTPIFEAADAWIKAIDGNAPR